MASRYSYYLHSPLNYTGGKHKLLPALMTLFPREIGTFVDLFCGGVNVGVNARAEKYVFNDISSPLIDLYREFKSKTAREVFDHIEGRIEEYGLSKTNNEGYLELRKSYNENRNPLDLFVLTAYSFNNQIRFNSEGEFNMPFGENRSSFNDSIRSNLASFLSRFQGIDVSFTNLPFKDFDFSKLTACDFVYCDPPYLITEATYNSDYTDADEKALYSILDGLNSRGVRFGLSNVLTHSGKTNEILEGWISRNGYHVEKLKMNYTNCSYHKKDKETGSQEVYVFNYEPEFFLI